MVSSFARSLLINSKFPGAIDPTRPDGYQQILKTCHAWLLARIRDDTSYVTFVHLSLSYWFSIGCDLLKHLLPDQNYKRGILSHFCNELSDLESVSSWILTRSRNRFRVFKNIFIQIKIFCFLINFSVCLRFKPFATRLRNHFRWQFSYIPLSQVSRSKLYCQ